MGTKMKGLLKGLRYISQIFDDGKEPEMQIGFPTDVKHVAHIGWDGPSVDSPSWMKEFKSPTGFQSSPIITAPEDPKEPTDFKWFSKDSHRRSTGNQSPSSPSRGLPEFLKPSLRQSSSDPPSTAESSSRESVSTPKSRNSRRRNSKDSLDGPKLSRPPQDPTLGSGSPRRNIPDIPRKSRGKKPKDPTGATSSRTSRSTKPTIPSTYTSPFSDPGPGTGSILKSKNNNLLQISSLEPLVQEEVEGKMRNSSIS